MLGGVHCGESLAPRTPDREPVAPSPVPSADALGAGPQANTRAPEQPPAPLPSFLGSCGAGGAPERSPAAGYYAPSPVQQAIDRLRDRWDGCYTEGLVRDPKLAGKVVVKIEMNEDGRVCKAAAQETSLQDPEVVACVVRSFLTASFPPPGRTVSLVYPVVFRPGK